MCACGVAQTWEQRLWGFALCFGLGSVLSILSTFFVSAIFLGRPEKFALLYSFGQFCSIGSSMFLMGPWSQLQSMFAPERAMATSVYLATVVLTIVAALKTHSGILVFLMIAIQFCALAWYCLSFIPYAREMAWNIIKSCIGMS